MSNNLKPIQRFAHFHQVDTWIWYNVRAFLKDVVSERVNAGRDHFQAAMSLETAEEILLFIEEMETMYEHPRSDSRRWREWRVNHIALTQREKKPKPHKS